MMRSDEDRVEAQGQREDHHRVKSAGGIRHDHIGELQLEQPRRYRSEHRDGEHRHRKGTQRRDNDTVTAASGRYLRKREPISDPRPTMAA